MSDVDRTQHVIDAIDGALGDWTVSPDAMRWTPEPEQPRSRLVLGGSPAALLLAERLDDPEVRARFTRSLTEFAEAFRRDVLEPFGAALTRAAEALAPALAGLRPLLPENPPADDPRARALWLRQQRNTGPERTSAGRAKRPRRLP